MPYEIPRAHHRRNSSPCFQRRHYDRIARGLSRDYEANKAQPHALHYINSIAHNLALEFARDNPRFDRSQFLSAIFGEDFQSSR